MFKEIKLNGTAVKILEEEQKCQNPFLINLFENQSIFFPSLHTPDKLQT